MTSRPLASRSAIVQARTNLAFTIPPPLPSSAKQDNKSRPSDEPDHSNRRYTLNGLAARNVPTGNIARAMGETTRRPMSIPGFRGEIASVQAVKRDAQLAANLARAQLAEEARQLIVGDYARAASGIAATLARLAAIESEVRCSTRASRAALLISKSRRSAGGTVGLSGITSDDADFWPTRPRP
jgi:hypothetical protein